MTAQLSRERLEEIAALPLKTTSWGLQHAPGAYSTVYSHEIVEMARMLLAGLDSEPVAVSDELELVLKNCLNCQREHRITHYSLKDCCPHCGSYEWNIAKPLGNEQAPVPTGEQGKPYPVMAVKVELGFLENFDRIISERDGDIEIGQLGCGNYDALMLAALDAFRAAMLKGES